MFILSRQYTKTTLMCQLINKMIIIVRDTRGQR